MVKFLLSSAFLASFLPLYLSWGRGYAEEQLNRMQAAAFNTPGAEAPVTPPMVAGGAALVGSHFIWSRVLGLRGWQAIASLVVGSLMGISLFLWQSKEPSP